MAIGTTTQRQAHAARRASAAGRWLPLGFYAANVALWIAAGVQARVGDLLWLALLSAPPAALYWWRTRGPRP